MSKEIVVETKFYLAHSGKVTIEVVRANEEAGEWFLEMQKKYAFRATVKMSSGNYDGSRGFFVQKIIHD